MLNKFYTDIKQPKSRYELCSNHSSTLDYYYFIFDEKRLSKGKDQKLISRFDENGIPINSTYIDVEDKSYVYFPITIGQVGLAVFHTYLKIKNELDECRFLKFVDWFYNNAEISEKSGVRWMTDVSLPAYKNPGPWQSAFAQSRGISILLRGYQLTHDMKYSDMAKKALIPFSKKVSEGGVTSFTKWGPFYEEYTAGLPTLVLNGMIFSLCGIYDYVRVFPDDIIARQLFDGGINTLIKILPEYDLGFWSKYNLYEADWYPSIDPATIGYQRLHVTQLNMLYQLTGNEIFKEYADKFRKQDTHFNALKMYKIKFSTLKKLGRL